MAVSQNEVSAAYRAARRRVDATGYGHWVSDALLMQVVREALDAAEKARPAPSVKT